MGGNVASGWGDLVATDEFSLTVAAPATIRPGQPLRPVLQIKDGYGQVIPVRKRGETGRERNIRVAERAGGGGCQGSSLL